MIMRRVRTQRVVTAVASTVVVLALAAPAVAASAASTTTDSQLVDRTAARPGWITNKPILKGVNEAVWAEFLGPTQDPWRPTGKVIATSGFAPQRDGFKFFNYSNVGSAFSNRVNKYLFGSAYSKVRNLSSQQMINLFGRKQVCLGHRRGKPTSCVLSPAAKSWMDAVNSSSNGGHCFGIATVAAQLFNNQLSTEQLGGGANAHSIPFKPALTRAIAQGYSLQNLATVHTVQPREAVKRLKRSLRPGHTPFTLSLAASGGGGHGVTPIALTRTGKGTYDIVIYDNNYPDRLRAIHANTNYIPGTRTQVGFDYELFTLPGQPPEKLVGSIGLWDVSKFRGKFACPFCAGALKSTVHLAPVMTDTPVRVSVTSPDGRRIRGMRTVRPSNPWLPGSPQPLPSFQVPRGKPFKLVIDNGANTQPVATTVAIETGSVTWELEGYQLPPGSVDSVSVSPKSGAFNFATSHGSDPALAVADHSTNANARVIMIGPNAINPGGSFSTKTDMRAGVFTFTPGPGSSAGGGMQLTQESAVGAGVKLATSAAIPLTVPVGSHLSWNYLKWNVTAPRVKFDVVGPDGVRTGQWVPLQRSTV